MTTSSGASVARILNFVLGGKDNYGVDRERAEEAQAIDPNFVLVVNEGRKFLLRAVRYMAECGIRQFLDIGTGLPAQDNVHDAAQSVDPEAVVVYADNDPVVLAFGRALMAGNDRVAMVEADLRDPVALLGDPVVKSRLDFTRPIGLVTGCTLLFVPEESDPDWIMAQLRVAMPPGSYMAITDVAADTRPDAVAGLTEVFQRVDTPTTAHSRDRVAGFLGEFELIEPGLVPANLWRPDGEPQEDLADSVWILSGVARKPGGSE